MKKLFKMFLIVTVILGFCGIGFAQVDTDDDEILGVDNEVVMDDSGEEEAVADSGDEVVADEFVDEDTTEVAAPVAFTKGDAVDLSGVIEVVEADAAKGQKYATIILKVGEVSYKLLPSKAKDAFKGLEAAADKSVNVKGTYLPADETHPLAAIQVTEWSE